MHSVNRKNRGRLLVLVTGYSLPLPFFFPLPFFPFFLAIVSPPLIFFPIFFLDHAFSPPIFSKEPLHVLSTETAKIALLQTEREPCNSLPIFFPIFLFLFVFVPFPFFFTHGVFLQYLVQYWLGLRSP